MSLNITEAVKHDLTATQNCDAQYVFDVTDADDVAINLTGYTAELIIKLERNAASTLLSINTSGVSPNSRIAITALSGRLSIFITDTDTNTVGASISEGVYGLFLIDSSGIREPLLAGKFLMIPKV